MAKEKITLIIPVYNEEATFRKHLSDFLLGTNSFFGGLAQWKNQDAKNRHVVIVNDGSTDRTEQISKDIGKLFGFSVVRSDPSGKNIGQGGAFIAGARYAESKGSKIVVTMDADAVVLNPKYIDELVSDLKISKKKMVVATVIEMGQRPGPPEFSGVRAIRIEALSPLFSKGKKMGKWVSLLEGHALYRGLQHLIPSNETSSVAFVMAKPFRHTSGQKQQVQFDLVESRIRARTATSRRLWKIIGSPNKRGRYSSLKIKKARTALRRLQAKHPHLR